MSGAAGQAEGIDRRAGRRERAQAAARLVTVTEIKQLARGQMAAEGVAGINLRAIAREMDLTVSALYRYFDSRDALVSALIFDAYGGLGDAEQAALDAASDEPHEQRFRAVAGAYRRWALAFPAEYALILGGPLPGYTAPVEPTRASAARHQQLLLTPIAEAYAAGALAVTGHPVPPHLAAELVALAGRRGLALPAGVLQAALHAWATLHGMVSLEVFGHVRPAVGDAAEALFATGLDGLVDRLGFVTAAR